MSTPAGRLGAYDHVRIANRNIDEFIGICRGVIYDGQLNDAEIIRLEEWCHNNRGLASSWPLDVIANRLGAALEDGIVDDIERADLLSLVTRFVGSEQSDDLEAPTQLPLTDPAPSIVHHGNVFCFTGTFAFGTRKACEAAVLSRGGRFVDHISSAMAYLVIGSRITGAWIHTNYGRKIESAAEMARGGAAIGIVTEAHWTRSLSLTPEIDDAATRQALLKAVAGGTPVAFLYRGSRRTIRPIRLTEWLKQEAIEGEYIEGDSPDTSRQVRTYLLSRIAQPTLLNSA